MPTVPAARRPLLVVALAGALAAPACASSVTGRGDAAQDGGTSPPPDGSPGLDAPAPSADALPALDAAPALDAPAPGDAPTTLDVPRLPDGALPSLEGAWRAVRLDVPAADGGVNTFTDRNTPVTTAAGMTVDVRANGMLYLSAARFALAFGFLTNDQFFVNQMAMDAASSLPTGGNVVPGVLDGDTFRVAGATSGIAFERNADGTIAVTDRTNNTRTTWARTSPVALPGLPARYRALAGLYHPMTSAPFAAARVALAWDLPGAAPAYVYANDAPLPRFGPYGNAAFNVVIAAVPMGAQATVMGIDIAVAYPIVYDDVDADGRYTEGGADVLRGISPVAIVVRGMGDDAALAGTAYRDLVAGAQLARVNQDFSTGRQALTPFDPTLVVAPDVPVAEGAEPGPLPDLLR